MSRAESKNTPKVLGGFLYGDEASIALDTAAWFAWLGAHLLFYVELPDGGYTARRELRPGGGWYWYAYRRAGGRLHKAYIGRTGSLTRRRLMDVGEQLADKAKTKK